MPQVTAQGRNFTCETGANLRQVLLEQGIDLYNSNAKFINCMSIGTCRNCAVQIEVFSRAEMVSQLSSG
jgi:ferredoxin